MRDSINRQAAIDAVHEEFDDCLVWDESGKATADEVERVLGVLPSAEPRWIPVTEQLPTPNELEGYVPRYYLIQNEFGDMMVAAYRKNTYGHTWWEQMYVYKPIEDGVIAWMPLPKPYERSEDD